MKEIILKVEEKNEKMVLIILKRLFKTEIENQELWKKEDEKIGASCDNTRVIIQEEMKKLIKQLEEN